MPPEIVVTGLGIVSPAGVGAEPTWSALLAHRRCVCRTNDPLLATGVPVCAAPVSDADLPASSDAPASSRACRFAVLAAREAAAAARLHGPGGSLAPHAGPSGIRPGRHHQNPEECFTTNRWVQVVLGTSKPFIGVDNIKELLGGLREQEASRAHKSLIDPLCGSAALAVAAALGAAGPVQTCVTACASGTHAIVRAAQLIADGDAHQVLCGGGDASLQALWLAAYQRMGVLAAEHPGRGVAFACRPFDRTRDGFAVGEGAAVLVLETAESARRRSASPIATIAGWATGTDPTGLTQLDPTGTSLARVISLACQVARCPADAIGAVIAHGTGTPDNDAAETRAIRLALGPAATRTPIVSVKGAIGHLLGAAGAVETALAVLACRDRRCPGNATLLEPDPEMADLTLPTAPFALVGDAVLKTSLGFGGHLAAIVVKPVC